jgi:hypothetical protein
MYKEVQTQGLTTIDIGCDARRGRGTCTNQASVTMRNRDAAKHLLFRLGWRLSRGHQICSQCLGKKRYSFPKDKSK